MKGARFYFDYGSPAAKRRGGDAPNALVIFLPHGRTWDTTYDAAAALTYEPNAPVCGTSAAQDYLTDSCKRVSEAEAYRVHPNLRKWLAAAEVASQPAG